MTPEEIQETIKKYIHMNQYNKDDDIALRKWCVEKAIAVLVSSPRRTFEEIACIIYKFVAPPFMHSGKLDLAAFDATVYPETLQEFEGVFVNNSNHAAAGNLNPTAEINPTADPDESPY
jgi:hypothetical protein